MLICAGWRDGYRTAALRMARRAAGAVAAAGRAVGHTLPDRGVPGPRYPFLAEMARFFHRHLDERTAVTQPDAAALGVLHRQPGLAGAAARGGPRRVAGSERWPEGVEPTTLTLGGPAVAPASVTDRAS